MADDIKDAVILGPSPNADEPKTNIEESMPAELTDLTPAIHNLLLKSGTESHLISQDLIQKNAISASSIVQHTAARQLNEVDAIESAATEKILKVST